MKFLSASASTNNVGDFNKSVQSGDTVFVIFHSPNCGHCVTTLPEWRNISSELGDRYKRTNNVMVADIDADVMSKTPYGDKIQGFPTMWCITQKGKKIEPIENARLKNIPRTVDAFIEWIELKMPNAYYTKEKTRNNSGRRKKRYRVTPYPNTRKRRRHSHKRGY